MSSANQQQAKSNVGSVLSALETLIAEANSNADWNESVGASVSPGMLRDLASAMQAKHDALLAIFNGESDIVSISS